MDHNEKRQISEYMPDDVIVEGDCRSEDNAVMSIKWTGHKMVWYFGKVCKEKQTNNFLILFTHIIRFQTPGREGWFIKTVELIIDSGVSKYKDLHVTGKRH